MGHQFQDSEVSSWLLSLGLECYSESFRENHIDFQTLRDLSDDHLKELGVTVGHRVRMRKALTSEVSSTPDSIYSEPQDVVEYGCKIIVVGDVGAGKTSLIRRITRDEFDANYKATIGVDFSLKELTWNKSTIVFLQLWDIAGQERFANMTRMYYKEARGAFVVYDVTRERTLQGVLKWKADIDSKVSIRKPSSQMGNFGSEEESPLPCVLLAAKCDLDIPSTDLDTFCSEAGFVSWFATSAKDGTGVSEAVSHLVSTILQNDDLGPLAQQDDNIIHLSPPEEKRSTCCRS